MPTANRSPKRGLSARHIRFITLGGAIGAGLFLGSGPAIAHAGPALLLAYSVAGLMIFLMARALGELALYKPAAGSFSTYARELIGPRTAFITGWSYWLIWLLVGVAELTGIGVLMRFWWPQLPQWIPALAAATIVYVANRSAVRFYGELEFWLALLKVVTIVVLLTAGSVILVIRPAAQHVDLVGAAFFPHGWRGVVEALPAALFAFGGLEVVGLTAAEANHPQASLPRAINGVALRILIFYIGSLAIMMALFPWDRLSAAESPFVTVLARIGFPAAAGILNLVVISAMLSSCNSGMFASSRMLHALSLAGDAPASLSATPEGKVPTRCVNTSAVVLLLGVAINYFIPERAFAYLMSVVSALLLWTWGIVMICHLAYRRAVARGECAAVSFRLPLSPYSNWLVLGFMTGVAVILSLSSATRPAYYTAIAWFFLLIPVRSRIFPRSPQAGRMRPTLATSPNR